ncbi:hypothetical protein [Roseomonas xinghualingensis]|uniref:hypothetical protein n=1 Tax=Roseomonas xinghualingensis TaxID=2986475 RepID=UPI0021F212FB|nr:hypothetical protein [Roseomonas sp. SXEYE001]MCV4207469.1 hypothetical protein [Roseomonas sp. SXEYE001]
MRRLRTGFARLLALLLMFQGASAMEPHAQAMTALGRAMVVELCSAHGIRTVVLGEDGQPLDQQEAPDCCAPCLMPVAAPPPVSMLPPRSVSFALVVTSPGRPGLPPLPPRAPPQQPRAPPIT